MGRGEGHNVNHAHGRKDRRGGGGGCKHGTRGRILEDLDERVDRTSSKMGAAIKKVNEVLKMSNGTAAGPAQSAAACAGMCPPAHRPLAAPTARRTRCARHRQNLDLLHRVPGHRHHHPRGVCDLVSTCRGDGPPRVRAPRGVPPPLFLPVPVGALIVFAAARSERRLRLALSTVVSDSGCTGCMKPSGYRGSAGAGKNTPGRSGAGGAGS